jgi:hypothetical protein
MDGGVLLFPDVLRIFFCVTISKRLISNSMIDFIVGDKFVSSAICLRAFSIAS